MKHVIKGKCIAVDTETTGLDPWHGDEPFCVALCNSDGESVCFSWDVDPWTRVVVPDPGELAALGELLEDPRVEKVFHNSKFDCQMIESAFGIQVAGKIHDTIFAAHACNSQEPSFALKTLSEKYLRFGKEDQDVLKKAVVTGRREGKRRGWLLAEEYKFDVAGNVNVSSVVEADYWIPKALDPGNNLCEEYCVGDTERTMLLHLLFQERMRELDVIKVYESELELWPITYAMEAKGVRVNEERLLREIQAFVPVALETRKFLETEAAKLGFPNINVESGADLGKVLFQGYKIPPRAWTPTGQPAVNVNALEEYLDHPFVQALFRYRGYSNGLVNFFHKYNMLGIPDGLGNLILHPNFQQVGPVTGRFSCRNPNLQNVANGLTTRSPVPIQARTPFGPRNGYVWLPSDYSQLEVRIFADVSQEPIMLRALEMDEDLHTACANKAWGTQETKASLWAASHALELEGVSDVASEQASHLVAAVWKELGITSKNVHKLTQSDRDRIAREWLASFNWDIVAAENSLKKKNSRGKAKMILFSKVFGGGPNAIKDLLHCTIDQAKLFLNAYDDAMPGIVKYIHYLSSKARKDGYIINRYGRRLAVDRDKAYRAVNYMVQGSAADLLKRSMRNTATYLKGTGLDACIVLTIHDELVFEFNKNHTYRKVLRDLCRIMEDHGGAFGVPTPVEMSKVVDSWDAKENAVIGNWNKRRELEWN